jgi:hypothetical protein
LGSRWIWEKGKGWAEEVVTVYSVEWNGEEWWVRLAGLRAGLMLNDLSRFWEACTPYPWKLAIQK